jgi:hypothetical protein
VPYCGVNDLLLGDLLVAGTVDKNVYVQNAADEIDAAIGVKYATPVNLDLLARHSELLLKNVNVYIATGRLCLALAAGSNNDLNSYGLRMLSEGLEWLCRIRDGATPLDGDPSTINPDTATTSTGPKIINEDELSGVEAFYANAMRTTSPFATLVWAPGPVSSG